MSHRLALRHLGTQATSRHLRHVTLLALHRLDDPHRGRESNRRQRGQQACGHHGGQEQAQVTERDRAGAFGQGWRDRDERGDGPDHDAGAHEQQALRRDHRAQMACA